MTMKLAKCLLTAAFLLVPAWPLQEAHAQTKEATSAQVNQLFAQAQTAFAKGDKVAACDAYKAAWALQKSYDIAGNLGGVELKLGRYRDAAEHLAFALDDFPPTGEPAQRQAVERKLAEALNEIGRLHVRVSVDGASVTVNGVKGSEQHVALTLVPESIPERRRPSLGLVIGGGATAVVGIGTGIGLLVAGANKAADANTLIAPGKAAKLTCTSPPQPGPCSTLHSTNVASDTLHNAGVPVLVVGAAVAAATLTYGLWPRGGAERSTGVRLVPVVGAGGGGLLVDGRF